MLEKPREVDVSIRQEQAGSVRLLIIVELQHLEM
jgi:hypothetical protein